MPSHSLLREFVGLFALSVSVLVLVPVMTACAEVPTCPPAGAMVLEDSDGRVLYAFDADGIAVWHAVIRAEARGKCRYPPKGIES